MNTLASTIAELRVLIGYLGEKNQAHWWGGELLSPSATAFLAPIFNRSLFLAQYQGSSRAAAKVHDEAIGVELDVKLNPNLHDREIRIDNGWTVKIGCGLDFYQRPGGWFEAGANDHACANAWKLRPTFSGHSCK